MKSATCPRQLSLLFTAMCRSTF